MSRSAKITLEFTFRAIADLEGIVDFSLTQFGKKATDKYLEALNAALYRIQSHPDLLRLSSGLSFLPREQALDRLRCLAVNDPRADDPFDQHGHTVAAG